MSIPLAINAQGLVFPTEFSDHRTTDHSRWSDYYDTKATVNDLSGKVTGMALDDTQQDDITSQATSIGFTVVSEQGGEVTFTATNSEDGAIYGSVSVNGILVSSTEGIAPEMPITQNITVAYNDVVTCSNVSLVMFIPYVSVPGIGEPLYTADKSEIAFKYHTTDGQTVVKSLADIVVGDDLSGLSISRGAPQWDQSFIPEIVFENGTKIGSISSGTFGLIKATGTSYSTTFYEYGWHAISAYCDAGSIVTSVSNNKNEMCQQFTYTTTAVPVVVDPEYNYKNKTNVTDFFNHRNTDTGRWQDLYSFQRESLIGDAESQGMMADEESSVDITSQSIYTVTNDLGGIATVTISNSNGTYSDISINGTIVYSTDGIIDNVSMTKSFSLVNGDILTVTNPDQIVYTPFIPDPSSEIVKLNNAVDSLQNQNLILQNKINDLEASVQNKTIANQSPIDITNMASYTVNNALGARLSGQGIRTIGLLGIVVLSTGTVTVNGTQVYDNTSLLSIGDAAVLSINVADGTVISSSGMEYVDITNYVQGTI